MGKDLPRYWMGTHVERFHGVLGTTVTCKRCGVVGWVRTSLVRQLIAIHVANHHVVTHGGPSA